MSTKVKKLKVTLVKACVIEGENAKAFSEHTLPLSDARFLIGSLCAVDASTEEGKETLEEAKKTVKKADTTKK